MDKPKHTLSKDLLSNLNIVRAISSQLLRAIRIVSKEKPLPVVYDFGRRRKYCQGRKFVMEDSING